MSILLLERLEEVINISDLSLTIAVLKQDGAEYKRAYEFIPTFEEANLLAQHAMKNKDDSEFVIIFPGWNRNLTEEEKIEALRLAEKYSVK